MQPVPIPNKSKMLTSCPTDGRTCARSKLAAAAAHATDMQKAPQPNGWRFTTLSESTNASTCLKVCTCQTHKIHSVQARAQRQGEASGSPSMLHAAYAQTSLQNVHFSRRQRQLRPQAAQLHLQLLLPQLLLVLPLPLLLLVLEGL